MLSNDLILTQIYGSLCAVWMLPDGATQAAPWEILYMFLAGVVTGKMQVKIQLKG